MGDLPIITNGFHFRKEQPVESHIIIQAQTTDGTESNVLQNTTTIPSTGEFSTVELNVDSAGFGTGRFSDAPNGQMAYCNGVDSMIYGGFETRVGSFIIYDPDGSLRKDYTVEVQNSSTDTLNLATLTPSGAGNSANAVLLLDFDTGTTDTSAGGATHTMTSEGNAVVSTTQKRFGAKSLKLDGTGDWLTTPDHADFDFSDGTVTGDCWVYVDDLTADRILCGQNSWDGTSGVVDTERFWRWGINDATGSVFFRANFNPTDTWQATTTYAVNDAIRGSSTGDAYDYFFECGSSGSSTGVEPAFSTTPGGTTNDGGVTWTTRRKVDISVSTTGSAQVAENTWTHVAFVWGNNKLNLFVNGAIEASTSELDSEIVIPNCVGTAPNPLLYVGADGTGSDEFSGYIDEFRISGNAVWSANFEVMTVAYTITDDANIYIGSTRPLGGLTGVEDDTSRGIKFYIGTANTSAGTLSLSYWGGTAWTGVSSLSDGTASSGKPMAQTGIVSFANTDGSAALRVLDGIVLYWYKMGITAVDSTTTVSRVTVFPPFQSIKDVWNGEFETISSFQVGKTADHKWGYHDHTPSVSEPFYEYLDSGEGGFVINRATVAALDELGIAEFVIAGFINQQTAIDFRFAAEFLNSETTTVTIEYAANGSNEPRDWTSVGVVNDGTSVEGVSLAKSGVMSWNPPPLNEEFQTKVATGFTLYNYRIRWSAHISNDVKVYYVAGIPAAKTITKYKFPLFADDALWLCGRQDDRKNSVIRSMPNAPDVWNGEEFFQMEFGDEKELTAATALYSRLGSNIFNIKLFFKSDAMFGLRGSNPDDYYQYNISTKIGCVAPLTLHSTMANFEGIQQPIAIWQGNSGIYIFNNNSVIPIHEDIKNFFDQRETNTRKIHSSYINKSAGFVDEINREYHWLFADGTSTGWLNREFVYDLQKNRWYEADRAETNNQLQCGFTVVDTNGIKYNYGGTTQGYLYRLDNGTSFDGTAMTWSFWTGDIPPAEGSIAMITKMRKFKLISKALTNTTNQINVNHYIDTSSTANFTFTLSPSRTDKRVTNAKKDLNSKTGGIWHSFKVDLSSTGETFGFEPIFIGGFYKIVSPDERGA